MHSPVTRRRDLRYLWTALAVTMVLTTGFLIQESSLRLPPSWTSIPASPSFSPPGGVYDRGVQLEIETPYRGGAILFTVDGSVPTRETGTLYARPIRLSANTPAVTVVRARAVLPDGGLGPVNSASYWVGMQASLPMMSLIVDPTDMWDPERGLYIHATERGQAWERPVDITYVDEDRDRGFHIPGGLRIHGGISRLYSKKSLRLYFRSEYGLNRLEYPLFGATESGADAHSFKRLVLHSGGQDSHMDSYVHWTLLRNAVLDHLALEITGYATRSRPVLLFINGEPWGIYQIRERIDRHLLADRYGIMRVAGTDTPVAGTDTPVAGTDAGADLLDTPDGYPGVALIGDRESWDRLLSHVRASDPADEATYAYVESQVDFDNMIDYYVLQMYAANTDWPNKNAYQFRSRAPDGRWRWIPWDTDRGFGAFPFFSPGDVEANFVQRVLGPNLDKTRVPLFRMLIENPAFVDRFLVRAAHLLNTSLEPESVVALVDELAAELEPDIAYETTRWASLAQWEASVQEIKDFCARRPEFLRQHIVEWFGLEGTASLALNPAVGGSGTVTVNNMPVPELPWQGVYWQGIPLQVAAAPAPGYRFAGWDPPALSQDPQITLTLRTSIALTPRFEPLSKNGP
jgi:hypothetical protein